MILRIRLVSHKSSPLIFSHSAQFPIPHASHYISPRRTNVCTANLVHQFASATASLSPRSLLFSSRVPINPSPSDWWFFAWPPPVLSHYPVFPQLRSSPPHPHSRMPSTGTRRTFILNWLCVALPARRSSFHAAITAPSRHCRFIMCKLSRFNSLMHPALFLCNLPRREKSGEASCSRDDHIRKWNLANCFNHFQSATKLHIYSSRQIIIFLARLCYIFVLFPRAADLFLNSVTDGRPVRDAVIMCESPQTTGSTETDSQYETQQGNRTKIHWCAESTTCVFRLAQLIVLLLHYVLRKSQSDYFFFPRKSVNGGGSPGNAKKRGSFPRPDQQITQ